MRAAPWVAFVAWAFLLQTQEALAGATIQVGLLALVAIGFSALSWLGRLVGLLSGDRRSGGHNDCAVRPHLAA
jgi:hypothetical protein